MHTSLSGPHFLWSLFHGWLPPLFLSYYEFKTLLHFSLSFCLQCHGCAYLQTYILIQFVSDSLISHVPYSDFLNATAWYNNDTHLDITHVDKMSNEILKFYCKMILLNFEHTWLTHLYSCKIISNAVKLNRWQNLLMIDLFFSANNKWPDKSEKTTNKKRTYMKLNPSIVVAPINSKLFFPVLILTPTVVHSHSFFDGHGGCRMADGIVALDASGKNLTCFDCLWCLWLSLGAFGWI